MAAIWDATTRFRRPCFPSILCEATVSFSRKYIPRGVGPEKPIPYFWTRSRGHVITLYPIAPALVALPLVAPQIVVQDLLRPGWDRNPLTFVAESGLMAKRAMAVIVALTGVMLHRLLLALGLRRSALPAVLAACLGSDLWTVASQAPWQHGPAALALVMAIWLLQPQPLTRLRLALAGLATAVLFTCRMMDSLFAAAIVVWLAWTHWRALFWFLPAPIIGGLVLLGYNLWFFGTILGGSSPSRGISRCVPWRVRHLVDKPA